MSGKNTRTLLLDAAERLLLSEGWGGISIRKLGAEVGLSYAALYRHFSDMEDLRNALVERQYQGFLNYLTQAFDPAEPKKGNTVVPMALRPRDSLLSGCMAYLRYWAERPRHFQLYREWVAEVGALGWKDEPPSGPPEPLTRDLAAWKGLSPESLPVRRGAWLLQAGLFGLAMASSAEISRGAPFRAADYLQALEDLLAGIFHQTGV